MSKSATQRSSSRPAPRSVGPPVTIGRLAKAAQVGVETIRYYQRRRLLPVPASVRGGVRRYPAEVIERIRFIKRSQYLGFSLDEIRELMGLEDGGSRTDIRRIAGARLKSIRDKIAELQRMEGVLSQLLRDCENSRSVGPCPIIAAAHEPRMVPSPGLEPG
ncbi:MAG: MerR family transcriptional regulator [Gammaproteobacteria bacterium]|nr:MerR family transcriptional regulator [Gammaproteobacteria bacterium]